MGSCRIAFCLVVVLSLLPDSGGAQQVKSARMLDLLIRDYTFESYGRKFIRTGMVHSVSLPQNLSGIRADMVKYRCGSLRRHGARLKEFRLAAGVTVTPCADRVMVIRQFLEQNWSTVYYSNYDLSDYQLISPVLGLLAYNAGSPSEIGISAGEIPITVNFSSPLTEALAGQNQRPGIVPLCAIFGSDGKLTLSNMVTLSPYLCLASGSGHFGLVMELPPVQAGRKESAWKVAIGSSIGTALGIVLLGLLLVALFVKAKKRSKREEMERRAYEEEALQVSMVGNMRAPMAATTRTVPGIEHGYTPSSP
ncbi:hypothetical protein MLD38_010470 [Melastoma candidum]|uniref:Uncharacterized protein n=1 Tax=Melastoma candidum TaxID=119954 RepID=A0ACB9R1R9_9MYRT|nr:hypothetical protein MLD38_010470 [Melastoma candidum]